MGELALPAHGKVYLDANCIFIRLNSLSHIKLRFILSGQQPVQEH